MKLGGYDDMSIYMRSIYTPEFNMEPENDGFKRNVLFPGLMFSFHVKLQVSVYPLSWSCFFGDLTFSAME